MAFATPIHAATISVFPKIVGIFNADFSPVDPAAIVLLDPLRGAVLNPNGGKYIMQIDVLMTITDLQAGQLGFGNAAFDINFLDGVRNNADVPGWGADSSTVDSNGMLPQGVVQKWADNGDFGPSGTDLQSIIIGTAPRSFSTATGDNTDPRRSLGIAPYNNPPSNAHEDGEYAGSIFIDYDATPAGLGGVEIVANGGSTYDAAGELSTFGTSVVGGKLYFPIPEPSALALLGFGGALLVVVRKRR
jgi:hypothetical protein